MTGAIAISMAYGLPTRHLNDPNVEINEEAMIGLVLAAVPGAYLVDAFPWLRYVYVAPLHPPCVFDLKGRC